MYDHMIYYDVKRVIITCAQGVVRRNGHRENVSLLLEAQL